MSLRLSWIDRQRFAVFLERSAIFCLVGKGFAEQGVDLCRVIDAALLTLRLLLLKEPVHYAGA